MVTSAVPALPFELYDYQTTAVEEVCDAYDSGASLVFLDAPTGSGKTLLGEAIRMELSVKGLYICTTKGLQNQFLADFRYAKLLKGRRNYQTALGPPDITAADCTGRGPNDSCMWCDSKEECPYSVAKRAAMTADVAVLNTAYLLAEANYVRDSAFSKRKFIVADEADELERTLMGNVEFDAGDRIVQRVGLEMPKKGVHKPTIQAWLKDDYAPALFERINALPSTIDGMREKQALGLKVEEARWVAAELVGEDEEAAGLWVRDNDAGGLVLKATTVNRYGTPRLWRHSAKWLLMSGTIISPEEMVQSLGYEGEWSVVSVPMMFPVENRPIIIAPIANVTSKEWDEAVTRLTTAIERIMEMHGGDERILVHTVSYRLARELKGRIRPGGRRVVTYLSAQEKDGAFDAYSRTPGAVLLASSMDRGYDFKGDLARAVVVAKVPFPYLGDRQVSARTHMPGGDLWYRVQAVRTIMQMTGRGVRSVDDHCTTYILDRQFSNNLFRKGKSLFPKWWRDAIDFSFPVKRLL